MTRPAAPTPFTLRTLPVTAWLTELREGGSLPAIVETPDGDWVAKFRGAGQGARALLAELLAGGIARALGLPMPDLALLDLDASFGRAERDPEIQAILRASTGLNVGLRFLPRAYNFDRLAHADRFHPERAADVVWFDALISNVDRTARNPNLMVADGRAWLIDHGAALYFHHDWPRADPVRAAAPFGAIRDHVLLPLAGSITAAGERLHGRLDADVLAAIVAALPDALLMAAPPGEAPPFPEPDANRAAYRAWLGTRLAAMPAIAAAAEQARRGLAPPAAAP